MQNPWKTLNRKTVYQNAWIEVSHRDVLTPKGTPGIYGLVHFRNLAVGVVPLDQQGNTWLVGQYRYTLEQYSWEIPEGGCPPGEMPLKAARRELAEETGIRANHWEKILDLHTSNSVTDEAGVAYLATELSFGPPHPEETEEIAVRKLPFSEALDMVLKGEITDALSMAALFKVNYLMENSLINL